MQSGNVQTGAVGLFAQLLNVGLVEEGALDSGSQSDFIDAMGNQIRGLLAENGVDSDALESVDNQALVAHFLSAMQGQTALDSVDAESAQGRALASLDRLLSGLEAGQLDGAQADAEHDADSSVAGIDRLEAIEALPAFVLEQLAQSAALGGAAPGQVQVAEGALSSLSGQASMLGQVALSTVLGSEADSSQIASRAAQVDPSVLEAGLAELMSRFGRPNAESGTLGLKGAAAADLAGMSDTELSEFVEALQAQLGSVAVDRTASSIMKGLDASLAQGAGSAQGDGEIPDSIAALMGRSYARDAQFDAVGTEKAADDQVDAEGFLSGLKVNETQAGPQRAQIFDLSKLLQPGGEGRLAEQVKWSIQAGLDSVEMKLHPPSLGTLDVRVTMDGDKASVQFLTPHPIVKEVLEAAMPRLRDALAQDGVALVDVSVSEHRAGGRDESAERHPGTQEDHQGLDAVIEDADEALGTAVGALSRRMSQHDYFV
ncbi:flagellar hook-length control protein FliK [Thiorhodococcus mannitoliphagus]|uniref:Flagellar hook-length control protein FliK n=1 Tax=Thiorhodococcus mannitoliphagus TaxID=329406 RepID=A0A6P1DRF8_9GAMM|nr:flagellar hook-length control protein FliK [Thiorhodococcus mannitoliphagus]NEX20120.1 flagellar hook-length control protein FliK [Thiorhodococcus mannitoliphagus]